MLKKSVTYEDFNGNEVTETFSFHLSKAELIEMEAERRGGLAAYLQHIVDTNDGAAIINAFKDLLTRSIGKVSDDGRRFEKNEAIRDDFMESPAYSELFMSMATDAGAAAEFVNGIIPKGLPEQVAEIGAVPSAPPQRKRDDVERTPVKPERTLTQAEAREMSQEELLAKMKDGYVLES